MCAAPASSFSTILLPGKWTDAPWPPDYPLWKKLWLWFSETGYTAYGRMFGFPNAHQYLPHPHFRCAALEISPVRFY